MKTVQHKPPPPAIQGLVRIEPRSKPEHTEAGMQLLGMDGERTDLYKEKVDQLLDSGKACSKGIDPMVAESTVKASVLSLIGAAKELTKIFEEGGVAPARKSSLASRMKQLQGAVEDAMAHKDILGKDDPALARFSAVCTTFSDAWHRVGLLFRNEKLGEIGDDITETISLAFETKEQEKDRFVTEVRQTVAAASALATAIISGREVEVKAVGASLDELAKTELKGPLSESQVRDLRASVDELQTLRGEISRYRNDKKNSLLQKLEPKDAIIAESLGGDSIGEMAAKMLEVANNMNEPVAKLFNEAWLVAKPGSTGEEVYNNWEKQQETVLALTAGPDQDLYFVGRKLEDRIEEEEDAWLRDSLLTLISEHDPRSLEDMIRSLEAKSGDEVTYRDYLMAGASELEHPGAIAAFAQHFCDALKKNLTDQQAKEQAIKKMHSWVEQKRVAPGTESAWSEAIDSIS